MKSERIRDPIHDIIVFDDDGLVDVSVWELLKTPDMQRLRRIKQLGVSEFVFPSATHTLCALDRRIPQRAAACAAHSTRN